MSRLLRILPAFALLLAAASAHSQYYNPAEQEMLRNARLALLPNYFHNAAAFGNVEMVRKFLATGVRVDLRDREGRTMLMLSVETSVLANQPEAKRAEMLRGKIAAAQALLERGADPRLKSNGGFTVLHTAAHLGEFAPLMEQFIAKGADANAVDTWGRTAMFTAVYPNDSGPIEVLLRHGADPNVRDLKKWTPLLLAALRKNVTTAARLVEAGADPSLPNEDGVTALQLATDSGDAALIAAMKKK